MQYEIPIRAETTGGLRKHTGRAKRAPPSRAGHDRRPCGPPPRHPALHVPSGAAAQHSGACARAYAGACRANPTPAKQDHSAVPRGADACAQGDRSLRQPHPRPLSCAQRPERCIRHHPTRTCASPFPRAPYQQGLSEHARPVPNWPRPAQDPLMCQAAALLQPPWSKAGTGPMGAPAQPFVRFSPRNTCPVRPCPEVSQRTAQPPCCTP